MAGVWDDLKSAANSTSQKIQDSTRQAQEKWKQSEHNCVDCGQTIHIGERCASCQARRAAEGTRKVQAGIKEGVERNREEWQKAEHPCAICG
jgi:DnaJ-class molecular chaperone